MRFLLTVAAALLLALVPEQGMAQQAETGASQATPSLQARADDLASVLRGEKDADDVFGPQFLAEVPPEQLADLVAQLETAHGDFVGIDRIVPTSQFAGTVYLRFERSIGSGPLTLDPNPPHRIAGLVFSSFVPVDDSLAQVRGELEALPGEVGVLYAPLADDADPLLAIDPERQMAVGSTFKLYVLSALARSIEAGERGWADVVRLDTRSFPSGTMHLWPERSPVTLHTLATQMIAGSDNTATDALVYALGRETVEAEIVASGHSEPARMTPLLTTLELFALKGSSDNRRKYLAADEAAKRRILADFRDDVGGDPDKIVPPQFSSPTAIDTVEWFASARDVAAIMRRIVVLEDPTARDILAVYPALPQPVREGWDYAGYKGGSEPGVLNLSWLLRDDAGEWRVLVMSWNDPEAPLEKGRLENLAQRVLRLGL